MTQFMRHANSSFNRGVNQSYLLQHLRHQDW
jgi:hypothetical protein